jgi:hypothetical protein
VAEAPPGAAGEVRLLEMVRRQIRVRHYSIRTEVAYVDWSRRLVVFHGKRNPRELGPAESARSSPTWPSSEGWRRQHQGQATSALLLVYRAVLGLQLPWLDDIVAAKDLGPLPVVLTPAAGGCCAAGWAVRSACRSRCAKALACGRWRGFGCASSASSSPAGGTHRASARAPEARVTMLPENRVPALRQQPAQVRVPRPWCNRAAGLGRVWLAGDGVPGPLPAPPRGRASHPAAPMPRVCTRCSARLNLADPARPGAIDSRR